VDEICAREHEMRGKIENELKSATMTVDMLRVKWGT
jgi:hypothetical protein